LTVSTQASPTSLFEKVEAFGLAHEECGSGFEVADGQVLIVVRCAGCGASAEFEGAPENPMSEVGAFIDAIREWSALAGSTKH
jgi:hypothetical protein